MREQSHASHQGSAKPTTSLTSREWEVLDLQAAGLRYKEIADRLKIAPSTVNNHLARVREKLKASNLAEAINEAYGPRDGPRDGPRAEKRLRRTK